MERICESPWCLQDTLGGSRYCREHRKRYISRVFIFAGAMLAFTIFVFEAFTVISSTQRRVEVYQNEGVRLLANH